jgi:hypothetical protein
LPSGDRLSNRLVEVFSERYPGDKMASFGSGFLLGNGLVLTARHVLMPEAWGSGASDSLQFSARPLAFAKRSELKPAVLVWPQNAEDLLNEEIQDVAILRLLEYPDVATSPILLGLGEKEALGTIRVFAAGFPNFCAHGNIRDVAQITGRIPTLSDAKSGRYQITALKMEGGRDIDTNLDWHGISGAALFADHNNIIGVLTLRQENGRFDFIAERLDNLLERSDFATLLAILLASREAVVSTRFDSERAKAFTKAAVQYPAYATVFVRHLLEVELPLAAASPLERIWIYHALGEIGGEMAARGLSIALGRETSSFAMRYGIEAASRARRFLGNEGLRDDN